MKFGVYYVVDNIVNKITIEEEPSTAKNSSSIQNFIFNIAHKALIEINKKGILELDFAVEINRKLTWFNGKIKKMSDIFKNDTSNSTIYKINIMNEPNNMNDHKYIMQHLIKFGIGDKFNELTIE